MKIAITGHDGFIGTHLLNTLIYKKVLKKIALSV
jgi:nucleoside-diphosphate-sugar epimerase